MPVIGYKELSAQLKRLTPDAGGKLLRSSARKAMKPALDLAAANAPTGSPPYSYSYRANVDPYPLKTYKGNIRFPGYAARSLRLKTQLSRDKRTVWVALGVLSEAFYAINFYEFGTSSFPRTPWLEPSFKASLPRVESVLKSELANRLEKAIKPVR